MLGHAFSRSSRRRSPMTSPCLRFSALRFSTLRFPGLVSAIFAGLLALAQPARAEFTICNQTFEMANIAIGQAEEAGGEIQVQAGGQFLTRGWWKIGPNQCAVVIRNRLDSRYVYVFATDIFGKELLNGSVPLCTGIARFSIRGQSDCALRGHVEAPFIEVDTGLAPDWTMFIAAPDG